MAVTLVRDCPHCTAANIAMQHIGTVATGESRSTAAFSCNRCNEILCLSFLHPQQGTSWVDNGRGDFDVMAARAHAVVVKEYPEHLQLDAPASVSQPVARSFVQGLDNARRGNRDAAASMFRKAIDIATRDLDQSLSGKTLQKRIDMLAAAGKLTEDLKEWAHLIRLDGNQGVHDEDELSSEEIAQLQDFTELFLIYTFTLPAQVAAKKAAATP